MYASDSEGETGNVDDLDLRPSDQEAAKRFFGKTTETDDGLPPPPPGIRSVHQRAADERAWEKHLETRMKARRVGKRGFLKPDDGDDERETEPQRSNGSPPPPPPQPIAASVRTRPRGYTKLPPPPRGIRSSSIMAIEREAVKDQLVRYHGGGGLEAGLALLEGDVPRSVIERFRSRSRFRNALDLTQDSNFKAWMQENTPSSFSGALRASGLYDDPAHTGDPYDRDIERIRRNCARLERSGVYDDGYGAVEDHGFYYVDGSEAYGLLQMERDLAESAFRKSDGNPDISPVQMPHASDAKVVQRAARRARDIALYYGMKG